MYTVNMYILIKRGMYSNPFSVDLTVANVAWLAPRRFLAVGVEEKLRLGGCLTCHGTSARHSKPGICLAVSCVRFKNTGYIYDICIYRHDVYIYIHKDIDIDIDVDIK